MWGDEFYVGCRGGAVGTGVGDGLRKIVGVFPAIASKYAVPNSVAGSTLVPSGHWFHVVISCHVSSACFHLQDIISESIHISR